MQALIEYQDAARAFRDATRKLTDINDAGGEPTRDQIAAWCSLNAETNAATAEAAAAVPETSEDAAAKLELAAAAIERAAFEDGDALAARARGTAAALAGGQDCPDIAARVRRLLASCEYANLAFYCNHGFSCPGHAIEHLRTALAGLTRLRLAA